MPKVPQVFASGDTGGTPGGARLNPEGFAALATSGTRVAAGELNQAARTYQHVYETLRAEDEKLDAERALGEAQRQFADADIELKNDASVTAEQYPQEVERRLRDIRNGVSKTLKYPGSKVLFERGLEHFTTQQTIKAKYDGLERMHAEVKASTGIALRDDTNAAVFAPTPELQQQGLDRGLARINSLLQRRIISGEEANAMNTKLLADVEQGRIRRDFKNPVLAPGIIAGLQEGKYTTLSPEAQHDLAHSLMTEQKQEDEARQKALKEAEKQVAEEAEKGIYDSVSAGNFNAARGFLTSARRFLTGDKYKEMGELIANRERAGVPSDPDTLKARSSEVYSVSNDPTAVLAKVQTDYRELRLDQKDYERLAGHLDTRINRGQDKALAAVGREHAQAEQMITQWTQVPAGIGSMFVSDQANSIRQMALEDLTRNSSYLGQGNESPLAWANRRKLFYISQLQTVATQRLSDIEGQLRATGRQLGVPLTDVSAITRARASFKSEADYYDAVRLFKEATELRRYQQQFRPGPQPGGAQAGASSTPAATPTGGNPLGR